MTVAPEVETEIRRLFFAEHWKAGTIAQQLNVHHDVVRRVIGVLPKPSGARASVSVVGTPWQRRGELSRSWPP